MFVDPSRSGRARPARSRGASLALLAGALAISCASWPPAAFAGPGGPLARLEAVGEIDPPAGFVAFCRRRPDHCRPRGPWTSPIELTDARLAELLNVHLSVNVRIRALPEDGVNRDEWEIPTSAGDCEDFALLKRHLLVLRGWPPSALRLTVTLNERGEGHTVLVVATDRGDLVLDNRRDAIVAWYDLPYTFIKQQSERHPMRWVRLRDPLPRYLMPGIAARN
mgnify:CR=1 FL=1